MLHLMSLFYLHFRKQNLQTVMRCPVPKNMASSDLRPGRTPQKGCNSKQNYPSTVIGHPSYLSIFCPRMTKTNQHGHPHLVHNVRLLPRAGGPIREGCNHRTSLQSTHPQQKNRLFNTETFLQG